MANHQPIAIDQTGDAQEATAASRGVYAISALIYPFWHLAAPSAAKDPWIVWWGVASTFLIVDWASTRVAFVKRHLVLLRHLCAWLCTLQLYLLAFVNDMLPFYAIGSVMSVIATSVAIRTRDLHLAWGGFVFVLSTLLFALEPDGLKLAYWGGTLTIVAASHYRLAAQVTAAELTHRHQEMLEDAVRERTSKLFEANRLLHREMDERGRLEEELRVAQRLEAVGRLAGGVAHEFNNLLTRIRLYAEFAREKAPADSELNHDVAEIQKAGRQATALTRQLLTFSRRAEVHTEVLDLNEVVETSSLMLRHLVGENIDVVLLPSEEPLCIRADRGQLEQVLVNLTLNARDAMGHGGRFTLATLAVDPRDAEVSGLPETLREQECVMLLVSDTGVGMDAETRTRAFDPFFTRKAIDRGTGLGLSIVYGILKQAGGHARLLSEPGKGARFELFWPRAHEIAAPRAELAASPAIRRGDERVLLVEDEAELRDAVERLLVRSGYEVLTAADPRQALRIAAATEEPIHLLLTDVVMPFMSGLDLAETLCAQRPETRVLLMSGHLDLREPLEQGLPPGAGFIAKPFESEALTVRIREVLDAARTTLDSPAGTTDPTS